jgi:EAL domain-containing protein (putative c-di-GMP-specific phosphodiesterase class I)
MVTMTTPTSFYDGQQTADQENIVLMYRPIVTLCRSQNAKCNTVLDSNYYLELVPRQTPGFTLSRLRVEEMAQLDDWAFQKACQQLHTWHEVYPGYDFLKIGVNLSAYQFAQPDLIEKIDRVLEMTEVKPDSLVLEIDESSLLKDFSYSVSVLEKLYQKEIQVTVDHFGTGYSSLKHLMDLQCQNLKFDRSFIEQLKNSESTDNLWFFRLMAELTETFSMQAIADGIENKVHLQQLLLLHCPYVQGDFISKPLTASNIENLLNHSFPEMNR